MTDLRHYVKKVFPALAAMVLGWSVLAFWSVLPGEARAENKAPSAASAFDPVKSVSLSKSNQDYYIIENQQIGDILVITGRVKNISAQPISFIRLRASLLNSNGRPLAERFFYASNILHSDELQALSKNQIVARLNTRDGHRGQNLNIEPGAERPFMVVFLNIPKDWVEYSLDVVSSSPAGPPADTEKTKAPAATSEYEEQDNSAVHITFNRSDQNHYFRENNEAGNILIITGKVRNSYPDKRSFIRLRGYLLGDDGRTLADRFIYAGNILPEEELKNLPVKEIYARLSVKGGQNGRNLNIESGGEIPFMFVFDKLPSGMSEYRIDPVGSTPAE